MSYRLYRTIAGQPDSALALGSLTAMELDPHLLGALSELLTAF